MNVTQTTNLQYSHTVGFLSLQGGRGFSNPVDFAFNSKGLLYVLSRGGSDSDEMIPSKRVTICTVDEEYISQFSSGGVEDGELMWPSAIALDADDNVYVADEALNRVSVFDADGAFLSKWGAAGDGEGEFNHPTGLCFDGDGNLLVTDSRNHRVQLYTPDGQFLAQWGEYGCDLGQFNMPWGVTTDAAGNVYVADWRNNRIQGFFMAAHEYKQWTGEDTLGQLNRPSGLAVDDDGSLYIADWGNERLLVLAADGSPIASVRGESGLSKWAKEYFTSNLDELEEREKADMEPQLDYDPEDRLRQESANVEKLFWAPTAVRLDKQGNVYVADTARARIQVFRNAAKEAKVAG